MDRCKDESQVRDIQTNQLYLWVGDNGKQQFPVTDFSDTAKWKLLETLGGGKKILDSASFFASISDPSKWTYRFEATKDSPWKLASGETWLAKKANDRFDSDFQNQEITVDGPTTTGGGWLREKTVTTKVTTGTLSLIPT